MSSVYKTLQYLESAKSGGWENLIDLIQLIDSDNPYEEDRSIMWQEQCYINFPILYLTSIYLYFYARQRNCDTFLFATRDCCHLYRVFKKLFPYTNVHYFNCSRLMFESATERENPDFKKYVTSIVKDVSKTIYIDLHGTGRRVLSYFEKEFKEVPYCFILSIGCSDVNNLPEISQRYDKEGKFFNLISESRGCSIEMINNDLIGTLIDYSPSGPVRNSLEYDEKYVIPYHKCINYFLEHLEPLNMKGKYFPDEIQNLIGLIYEYIREDIPIIGKYIEHVGRHEDPNLHQKLISQITFGELLDNTGVYGVVWNATLNNNPVAVKIISLTSNISSHSSEDEFGSPQLSPEFFKNHKKMTLEAFLREANHLLNLSNLNLSPLVRGYWIYNNQYGFIVMNKMNSSLKNILIKRNLNMNESYIIKSFINRMHNKGIIHGDLKPSNIGVSLNSKGKIVGCKVFDAQKVRQIEDTSTEEFKRFVNRDREMYHRHYEQNRSLAPK